MNTRNFLLGAAAGFAVGYAARRAFETVEALRRPPRPLPHDAAAYGRTRRALALSGIARSLAGASFFAFGPLADRLERAVAPLPRPMRASAFAAAATLLDALTELPVEFREGYVLEKRYGLSEQPELSWFADRCKEYALGAGVTGVLAALFAEVLRRWPKHWPYAPSAAVLPLLVFAQIAVPLYVLPLFNKYEPLEGPLERRLRALATRFGVGDAAILRMNMSKQTKKANAFVVGIGTTHRIVVADTLIEHFPDDEIEFVVAHELGHYVAKDSWRMIAASQAAAATVIFGAWLALRGSDKPADSPSTLARLQFWATIIGQTLRPAICAFARSREWAADRFALEATHAPETGAAAFRRLRDQNLAEDEQPGWYEFFFATHPSLRARIAALS